MKKNKLISIIMLIVLVAGAALTGYGVTGTGIYNKAAEMLGLRNRQGDS